jgi:hypothetical protein
VTPHEILTLAAAAASTVVTIWGNWSYLAEVRRGTNPRLVTWIIWTGALSVGAAGAARDQQWAAAALGAADAATALAVIVAGWRRSKRDTGWLDMAAAAAGGAGIMLLAGAMILPSVPMIAAVAVAVVTDFCAFLPTFANARNGKEPPGPFVIFAAGGVLALAGADQAVGTVYPAYLTGACVLAALLAVRGRAALARKEADGRAVREILDATWHLPPAGELARPVSMPLPPWPEEERENAVRHLTGMLAAELEVNH